MRRKCRNDLSANCNPRYGTLENKFNKCVKVCDPTCAQDSCFASNSQNIVSNGTIIRLYSNGETDRMFLMQDCKAYYKIKEICYQSQSDKPVTVDKCGTLIINQQNIYTITLTVYPTGCPMASLPIKLDDSNIPPTADIEIIEGDNTITVSGLIPGGTPLRFYTDSLFIEIF